MKLFCIYLSQNIPKEFSNLISNYLRAISYKINVCRKKAARNSYFIHRKVQLIFLALNWRLLWQLRIYWKK